VSSSDQAGWTQDLFELEQERNQLEAQLQHARNASPKEWEAMRGTVGSAVDSLQAGVTKLGEEISSAVSSSESDASQASEAPAAPEPGSALSRCRAWKPKSSSRRTSSSSW